MAKSDCLLSLFLERKQLIEVPISNASGFQTKPSKQKLDYKELLNENEFAVFSKLRVCRKTLAANNAVPAYAVFTDEELAGIARLSSIELCNATC